MTRTEQLNAMTEADKQADILANIEEHGAVRITDRHMLAFWGEAVEALKREGKVVASHHENYEGQYSYILVELPKDQP